MKARIIRTLAIFCVLVMNIGCDQISKNIVRDKVDYYEHISVMKDYLIVTKVENSGAFLSLGHSLPEPVRFILLSLFPLIVLGFALGFLFTRNHDMPKLSLLGFAFAIGGGIGNIYDRLVHGSVTDFLHIDLVIFRTGIFNMADVSIFTGVLIVMLSTLSKRITPEQETA